MYLERKVKYSGRLGALAIVIGRRMATETAVERRKVRYGNTEKCRQKENSDCEHHNGQSPIQGGQE